MLEQLNLLSQPMPALGSILAQTTLNGIQTTQSNQTSGLTAAYGTGVSPMPDLNALSGQSVIGVARNLDKSLFVGEMVLNLVDKLLKVMDHMLSTFQQMISSSQNAATQSEQPSSATPTAGNGGEAVQGAPSSAPSSSPTATGATNQHFLWKPVAEKDGNLVVLVPANLKGKVKSVSVMSPDNKKVLAKGKYSSVGNGGREHYRFTKPGASYPADSILRIALKDGSKQEIKIAEPGKRFVK